MYMENSATNAGSFTERLLWLRTCAMSQIPKKMD